MSTKRIKNLIFILLGLSTLLLGACSKENSAPGSKPVTFNLGKTPRSLDPQLATSAAANKIDNMIMEGFVIQGPESGRLLPAGAESWDISKDGKVWTFHLRKDAEWSNGDKITSKDYFFGLKRSLEPATAAPAAYMLYSILNAEDYNQSKIKDYSKVGIKVIDDYTIQITLANETPYFLQLMTQGMAFPLNEKFYNKVGSQYALEPDKMLFNGAYIIKEYVPNGKVVFNKNLHYWNKKNIKINDITYLMVNNPNTAANMFQSGQLDVTEISGPQIIEFKNNKDLRTVFSGRVMYLEFNVTNKFFSNVNIRRAIALGIDREAMCKNIMKDGSTPAYAFVPPKLYGGTVDRKLISFRKRFGADAFKPNIQEAQRLFKKGLKEIGYNEKVDGKPEVKLLCETRPEQMRQSQFIQQQLFKNFGLNVVLEPNTYEAFIGKKSQKDFEFVYTSWGPNYNYPTTFLNIWVTGGGNNNSNWSNAEYDKLVKVGENNENSNNRMNAMNKAEILLMKEMPIVPIYYDYKNWLIKSWLKNVVLRFSGTEIGFQWAYIKK